MSGAPDHRRLQRVLFRMQADRGFARALLAREPDAVAASGLGEPELALLAGVDPRALEADPRGERRRQVLGNAASEYVLTLAVLALREDGAALVEGFLTSPELHGALAAEGRLPLAFGSWAIRRAGEVGEPTAGALATLELAMAELRRAARTPDDPPALAAGEVALAPAVRLLVLPEGTHAAATALRRALDEGKAPAAPLRPDARATERVLLVATPSGSPHRLAELRVERLEPPADELLARAERPLGRAERAAFARAHGAAPDELESFLDAFVAEGVLRRGR